MPAITYPNQRMIRIHRERASSNFLGIKNENWQAAARDLGAHATMLYLYLASNANNYTTALSPAAVRQTIGMARSTYHDQFHKLVDRGYLVPSSDSAFDFYEVPQSVARQASSVSASGLDSEECPNDGLCVAESPNDGMGGAQGGQTVPPEDTEINNINRINNRDINNERINISKPTVGGNVCITGTREIHIPQPTAKGRERPKHSPQTPKTEVEH